MPSANGMMESPQDFLKPSMLGRAGGTAIGLFHLGGVTPKELDVAATTIGEMAREWRFLGIRQHSASKLEETFPHPWNDHGR